MPRSTRRLQRSLTRAPSPTIIPPPRSHSCLVALLAQFYPGKPPATAPLLAGCVATYVVLSLVSAAFATWVERDAFLVTRSQVRASE
jgi:hypothetical protein